jgi:hypothetical protein
MDTERPPEGRATVGMATETVARAHERADVDVRRIALLAVGLVALAVVVHVVLWFQMRGLWSARQRELPAAVRSRRLPDAAPEPRLQTAPQDDLRALRREEDERLGSYGWVDRRRGVVHVPIERAMELVVKDVAQ